MDDDAGQCRGIDRESGFRGGDGDQPGAEPGGGARRQPRRAGHHLAAGNERVSAEVFVGFEARPGKRAEPPVRGILNRIRRDPVEHGIGNADLLEHRLAAIAAPWQQQMPGLFAEKGHCDGGERRDPPHLAGRPVDAARDVDRDNRQAPFADRLDDGACDAVDRPRETRAKNAVDDEPGAVERRRRQRLDTARPARRSLRRVTAQPRGGAEQREAHRPAALRQNARRDETVAAVASRAAEHHDRLRRPSPRNRFGGGYEPPHGPW